MKIKIAIVIAILATIAAIVAGFFDGHKRTEAGWTWDSRTVAVSHVDGMSDGNG